MFSRIDLCPRYYQIRITKGHEKKIVFHTRYGSYKFLVMPFGFTNAPATFCTFMNDIFQNQLDDFMVVSINNILVRPIHRWSRIPYSETNKTMVNREITILKNTKLKGNKSIWPLGPNLSYAFDKSLQGDELTIKNLFPQLPFHVFLLHY